MKNLLKSLMVLFVFLVAIPACDKSYDVVEPKIELEPQYPEPDTTLPVKV